MPNLVLTGPKPKPSSVSNPNVNRVKSVGYSFVYNINKMPKKPCGSCGSR